MTQVRIGNGFFVDDTESALKFVREKSGKTISCFETICTFIQQEKNTIFYVDKSLNSSMADSSSAVYAWLDTGFVDRGGRPIFLSLLKGYAEYSGHIVGTLDELAESARQFFKIKNKDAGRKKDTLKNKYSQKIQERTMQHIRKEEEFLIAACNYRMMPECSEIGRQISGLNITFEDEPVTEIEEAIAEEQQEEAVSFTKFEEEITISMLLERMESMQRDLDEAIQMLETSRKENAERIEALEAKNSEYKRALVQVRTFVEQEGQNPVIAEQEKQILVIGGQELGVNNMYGIAKRFGLQKKDFDFIDYDKAKDYIERVKEQGRFRAIIIGSCPHKTTGSAGYSSPVEMFRHTEGMPKVIDARSKSGELKLTKTSFKEALNEIVNVA